MRHNGAVEREITAEVDLCLDNGRLNPAAVGWSRHPVHRANLSGWGRKKQWEYWGVVTPTHLVGVVLSNLDYAGLYSIYVFERGTGREWDREAVVPLVRDAALPRRSGEGTARSAGGNVAVEIEQTDTGSHLRASAPDLEVDLALPLTPGRESLGVVVPWTTRRFQYTVKDVGRRVSGTLGVEGRTYDVPEDGSFAVLDHGRGKWRYSVDWNWAAGSEPGGARAIQLGGQWTDGTGSTENALILDGRVHKISEDLQWRYDRSHWEGPWRISGERVQVELEPFHTRTARTNLGVVASDTHQCFGRFWGWALTDDGTRVSLDGLTGWAEEARQRW